MDLGLRDKVALVTGSTAGIGFEVARVLKEQGVVPVLNGRDPDRVDAACKSLDGATGYAADVTLIEACDTLKQKVLHKYGRLDILVCNVGTGNSVAPGLEDSEEMMRMLQLNFFSAINVISTFRDALMKNGGSIVCISSICGIEALGCPIGYAAPKAALQNYVINASRYLGEYGVRINSVAPGNILFEGSVWDRKLKENALQVDRMLTNEVPLRRLGATKDVASAVAYLASSCAEFVTGTTLVVDGGQIRQ